jgi:hypothetical protein
MTRLPVDTLRTGALRAELADGMLREIRLGDTVVLDAVHVAVRDPNWETLEPVIDRYSVQTTPNGFTVSYRAQHENGFIWQGTIHGEDGRIVFAMDGTTPHPLRVNRVGFCLLHPQELAGSPVTLATPAGPVEARFPTRISAGQPFPELTGMTYGGLRVDLSGDLFETEDQRNWTDASFKTYCTPLRLGFPRTIPAGRRVRQRVELTAVGEPAAPHRTRDPDRPVHVRLGAPAGPRLAPLGFALPSQGGPLTPEEAAAVTACRPAHLWVEADLREPEVWPATLARAERDAVTLGVPLHVEAVCDRPADLGPLVAALADGDARPDRLLVFDAASTTDRSAARTARYLLDRAGLTGVAVGGGSRANFAELNRADLTDLPVDVLCYAINPQVHAFDDASVMSTLRAQPATLAGAWSIAGGRPVAVGPVTLRPRFNAVATGPQQPTPGDRLPPQVDLRQADWFTAAWAVGCRAALAPAESLTLFEAAGWRGLVARTDPAEHHPLFPAAPGAAFPVHTALAALADLTGRPVLPAATDDPRVAVLAAVLGDGSTSCVLANLTPRPIRVDVDHDGRTPDEATALDGQHPCGNAPLTLDGYRVAVCRWRPRRGPGAHR